MKNHYETIIIGAGFGGLNAAIKLGKKKKDVLIIDKTNHHLFQPLLYQVATAGLSPADIATPTREILKDYRTITVIMDEVLNINKEKSLLKTKSKKEISFKNLIVATGARHSYFGNDQWQKFAPGLKSLDDAIEIRENILNSYELSEMASDQKEVDALTTFVVVGGGPTGVEMAGAIAEIAMKTLAKNFTQIDPKNSKIFLIENGDRVLSSFSSDLSDKAKSDLEKLGVTVKLNTNVTDINNEGVRTEDSFISSRNVIWAAGNEASPLLKCLDVELDKMGRVFVKDDCSVKDFPNLFIIGDAAAFKEKERYLPSLAPVASQQGKYVAEVILSDLKNKKREAFDYLDKGTMATIGKRKAILEVRKIKISGFIAWAAWCFVHILFLVLFRNKVSILMSWTYNYFTGKRGARLIKARESAFTAD